MLTLYHGGLERIPHPEIRQPNRRLDFGAGFYLTTSRQQAHDWVCRRLREGGGEGYVNAYTFSPEEARAALRVLQFDAPTEQWLSFVMANRQQPHFTHDYDIVCGPVANDRVYTAFALYESGVIDERLLIAELKTYRLVDQYLFHTSAALSPLTFLEAIPVRL